MKISHTVGKKLFVSVNVLIRSNSWRNQTLIPWSEPYQPELEMYHEHIENK